MVFMVDKSTEHQQHRNCFKDTHAVNSQVLEEHCLLQLPHLFLCILSLRNTEV